MTVGMRCPAVLALLLVLVGCDKSSSSDSSGQSKDPMERAIELRDKADAGKAQYPKGTEWLFKSASDEVLKLIKAGDKLVAGTKGGSVLVRAGSTTVLAKFAGSEVRGLWSDGTHVFVSVYPKKGDGVGVETTGKLVAVSLADRTKRDVISSLDLLDEIAIGPEGLYHAGGSKPAKLSRYAAPEFAKSEVVVERKNRIEKLVASKDALYWREADYSKMPARHTIWRWTADDEEARKVAKNDGYNLVSRPDSALLYTISVATEPAHAPGGGAYYEQMGKVLSIDPATGKDKPLTGTMNNAVTLALSSTHACVCELGPKLQFSKNASVHAIELESGKVSTLASGLWRPYCLLADKGHFYVSVAKKQGVAKMPVR
jgi:hypothetical protein